MAASHAQQDDTAPAAAPDWAFTGLPGPALRLFAPTSGALFAQTADALLRSDDAGATWRSVALPTTQPATPGCPRLAVVDPTDQTSVYAFGAAGLFKTTDDAHTWTRLALPDHPVAGLPSTTLWSVDDLAVSPADHRVVYATLITDRPSSIAVDLRSDDGGATWQAVGESRASAYGSVACGSLYPQLTNARSLLASHYGRHDGRVERSTDGGATWQGWTTSDLLGSSYPRAVVGGGGATPARFYVALNSTLARAAVFRTDDAGGVWSTVLYLGAPLGQRLDPSLSTKQVGGLAYDPANPDTIYVGVRVYAPDATMPGTVGYIHPPVGGEVQVSLDGGSTWQIMGQQDVGAVNDLVLGIDGQNLYAATDTGVWQIALTPVARGTP